MIREFKKDNPAFYWLLMLLVLSLPLYLFFRKSPNIPDLRFSELLVAQVYTTDMFAIYDVVREFFCLPSETQFVCMLLPLLPLKQMSGFKWWKLLSIMILVFVMVIVAFCLLGILSMGAYKLLSQFL